MLERLKAYYKDAMIINETTDSPNDFAWFYTADGQQIGILKEALTEQEKQLLAIFLTPMPCEHQFMTQEELLWHHFLINGNTEKIHFIANHSPYYRFIQFQIKQATVVDKQDFCEAMKGLFRAKVMIVWENNAQGVVIEKKSEGDNVALSFPEIIDTLSSDFYIDLHLFVGQTYPYSEKLYEFFHSEKHYFRLVQTYIPKQKVYSVEDVLPILFVKNNAQTGEIDQALHFICSLKDDSELLKTIKVFFECNLNVSLAAKKLYMHRNSLQYRIDKFIERTGIDIKQFKGAIATYLAILTYEHTNRESRHDA